VVAACARAARGYAIDLHKKRLTKSWLIVDPGRA
jgi:hypothetical protein